jgi:hypothetical protein
MADVAVTPRGYTENPDLMPTPRSQQKYGGWTWMLMMFSMNTCIPMFFLGPIGQSLGLNFWQALWGALVGNLAAVVVMWLNGVAGVRYGITYPVQLRTTFGFRGTHVPVVMRGLAGLVWFGIEAWTGSLAITMIIALVVYLGSFILVMLFGLQGIGTMANWAGPVMLVYFVWLVFWLLTRAEFKPNIPNLWISKAGYLSMPFMLYLAVQTDWWATVALNISDISLGINPAKRGAFGSGLFVGIVLCQMLGAGSFRRLLRVPGYFPPHGLMVCTSGSWKSAMFRLTSTSSCTRAVAESSPSTAPIGVPPSPSSACTRPQTRATSASTVTSRPANLPTRSSRSQCSNAFRRGDVGSLPIPLSTSPSVSTLRCRSISFCCLTQATTPASGWGRTSSEMTQVSRRYLTGACPERPIDHVPGRSRHR